MVNVKSLPIQRCKSLFCMTQARYWDGRIIAIGDPSDTIIGWCSLCVQFCCSRCTIKVKIPEQYWNECIESREQLEICRKNKTIPAALQCKKCGSFLGKYSDILVWQRISK